MQTAEFNHNDFSNTSEADKALMVRFFYKNVENKMESQAQGRPIFKEKTYIEIRIAGQRDAQACRPATHTDKQRFAPHFDAFEKRMEPPTEGMPLLEWSLISRTQAEELSFLHIKTVEQLASVKDSNIQNFMGGYGLRDRAVKWLETNDVETVEREKEEMRSEIDLLKEQIAKLVASAPPTMPVELASELDTHVEEGAAIPVPPAPAALTPAAKRARSRSAKTK